MIQRIMRIEPGYDCRKECKHDPPGDHGINGDNWWYGVTDGRRGVSLLFLSPNYPDTVERPLPACLERGMCAGLSTHEPTHAGDPEARPCDLLPSGFCKGDISYMAASDLWETYGDSRQQEQSEQFWLALEAEL